MSSGHISHIYVGQICCFDLSSANGCGLWILLIVEVLVDKAINPNLVKRLSSENVEISFTKGNKYSLSECFSTK